MEVYQVWTGGYEPYPASKKVHKDKSEAIKEKEYKEYLDSNEEFRIRTFELVDSYSGEEADYDYRLKVVLNAGQAEAVQDDWVDSVEELREEIKYFKDRLVDEVYVGEEPELLEELFDDLPDGLAKYELRAERRHDDGGITERYVRDADDDIF